jgi:transposase-like protein
MKLHGNAGTCPNSRQLLVERIESSSCSLREAADAAGISERTAYRWLKRWREEGAKGTDRSLLGTQAGPTPHATRSRTSDRRAPGACT